MAWTDTGLNTWILLTVDTLKPLQTWREQERETEKSVSTNNKSMTVWNVVFLGCSVRGIIVYKLEEVVC